MPKAKFKRKGSTLTAVDPSPAKISRPNPDFEQPQCDSSEEAATPSTSEACTSGDHVGPGGGRTTLVDLPEEVICIILLRLDVASIAALEATCKRIKNVLSHSRYDKYFFQIFVPKMRHHT